MRPIGHTDARDGRASALDTRLQDAWTTYCSLVAGIPLTSRFTHAKELLMPIQPSIAQLHHHILVTQHHDPVVSNTLGIFISAGYQLLPEREIVYDLDTPRLNCIGLDLEGKHLIIDGNIGAAACSQMIGDLTINGRAGPETGYQMIGSLTVNGFARGNVGHMMIGRLKNNGHITGIAGECMLGENDGRWNIGNRRTQFSHDLTNPLGLSHYELQSLIVREYS